MPVNLHILWTSLIFMAFLLKVFKMGFAANLRLVFWILMLVLFSEDFDSNLVGIVSNCREDFNISCDYNKNKNIEELYGL